MNQRKREREKRNEVKNVHEFLRVDGTKTEKDKEEEE